ncbi:MAG TPA: hypothetical protein VKB18_08400 [Gemmatimonadota bacterium]|nr:hypothetical protein [Gemmatimonadota bacterium]
MRASPVGSIPTRSRHPGRRLLFVALALAATALPARPLLAQQPDTTAAPGAAPDTTPADTARAAADTGAAAPDTAGPAASDTTGGGLPVSPLGAFARSLVLPGWGQAAAGKPGRGAFYFAAEAGSLFMVVKSQQKLSAARTAVAAGQADSSLVESRVAQREDWIVLSVFWALLSGVDAWVTANLADFQLPLTPPPDGSPGATLRVTIPVGGP